MKTLPNSCVCGEQESEFAFPVADWNFSNVTETGLMRRCLACASLFPDRFPDEGSIGFAYRTYYTVPSRKSLAGQARRAALEMLQGDMTSRHLPASAKRVLDFGCGSGAWLARMKDMRPELELAGTDITRPDVPSLPFRWIDPVDMPAESQSFDWITLSHVLEHVPDPLETLRSLVGCLAPGGAIWIATPNAQSYLFASLKGRARDADFPRHRQIFSRAALEQLGKACGLDCRFEMPPRINAVLNLGTGLAARARPPIDVAPPVGPLRPIAATASHLLKARHRRMAEAPEHILIASRMAGAGQVDG
jgi:SAM-dependent methyltransferase